MSAIVLDGKAIAGELRARAREAALSFAAHAGRAPGLAVVLVGDDPASHVYVAAKGKASEACSIRSFETRLPAETTTETLLAHIMRLNAEPAVDGILVQLPLPKQIDETRIIAAIDPAKDVDGLTPASLGALVSGAEGLLPCTPAGCVLLAKRARASLAGLHAVIVGRSTIVGKPAALLFLREDCTVTIAHSRTRDLPDLCRSADILVAAVGRPEMIRGDAIKPGAIVIDVGINRLPAKDGGNRLVGDVAFAEAGHAGFITPVPGGVGPMTIAGLMRNTVIAAYRRAGHTPPAME